MPDPIVTASQTSVVKRNPVLIIIGGLGSLLHVGLALLLAFGVSLTTIQIASIEGFFGVLLSIVLALVVNGQTTPYDPSVGNTPSAMALLRVLEAEVAAPADPAPVDDPPVEDPPEPEPVAAPAKKRAPAKKAGPAKKAAPRRK